MDLAFPLQLLSVVMAAILLHDVLEVHFPRTGRVLTPAGTDNGFSDKKKPCFVNRTYSGSDYPNRIFQYWHSVFRNCGIVGVFRRTGPHMLSSAHVVLVGL